jgi:hypothetical protein
MRAGLYVGGRLGDDDQHQGDDGHRDVHPEDRPPCPLGEIAAEDRADGGEAAGDAEEEASALPRSRRANVCTTMASAAGNMIAPPAPWTTRKVTIHASARLPLGVRPHMAEAPAKMMTPSTTIFGAHGVGQAAAEGEEGGQRQQVGVDRPLHAGAGQAELPLDLGTAIDTMVWSMKVIATAKIIAARTRFLDPTRAGHGPLLLRCSRIPSATPSDDPNVTDGPVSRFSPAGCRALATPRPT